MLLPTIVAFLEISRTVNSTCAAGMVLLGIATLAAKNDVAEARGLEKIVGLSNLCFGVPLGVFGAEHFAAAQGIAKIVPKFMPWPLFWTYLVGVALLAASLSIVTKIQVRWSGLLFGTMMFLFAAMMDLPAALGNPHNRFSWTLLLRQLSFGGGGWLLAASAMNGQQGHGRTTLFTVGRVLVGLAAVFYGVGHFLHPLNVPGVPLAMVMPTWIPAPAPISYLTGAILIAAAMFILLARKTHLAATYLGSWIFLLVLAVYGPILIVSLLDPSTAVKVDGINYFFDTLLYAGTILALARASQSFTGS